MRERISLAASRFFLVALTGIVVGSGACIPKAYAFSQIEFKQSCGAFKKRSYFLQAVGDSRPSIGDHVESNFEGDRVDSLGRRKFSTLVATSFLAVAGAVASPLLLPTYALETTAASPIPLVTVSEFEAILKSSAKSVQVVEFSGPQGETAVVRLLDGTTFGISDLVESSSDPRSPLRLVATCRGYKVPTKNVGLELALKDMPKRRVYMNPRVAEAAKKEEAKRERIAKDEVERLAAVNRMEEEEAMRQTKAN